MKFSELSNNIIALTLEANEPDIVERHSTVNLLRVIDEDGNRFIPIWDLYQDAIKWGKQHNTDKKRTVKTINLDKESLIQLVDQKDCDYFAYNLDPDSSMIPSDHIVEFDEVKEEVKEKIQSNE